MSTITAATLPWSQTLFRKMAKQIRAGRGAALQRTAQEYGVHLGSFEDTRGRSLLHISTRYGKTKISRYLLENGCSPHKQDGASRCPIYLAALHNRAGHLGLFSSSPYK